MTNRAILEQLKRIERKSNNNAHKLDRIEETVNLGTLDTTILGLMFFIITLVIAITTTDLRNIFFSQSEYIVWGIFAIVLFIPIVLLFVNIYLPSIIVVENRFSRKILFFSYASGVALFLFLTGIFLFIMHSNLDYFNKHTDMAQWIVIVLFFISVIYAFTGLRTGIKKYFEKNFPRLMQTEK